MGYNGEMCKVDGDKIMQGPLTFQNGSELEALVKAEDWAELKKRGWLPLFQYEPPHDDAVEVWTGTSYFKVEDDCVRETKTFRNKTQEEMDCEEKLADDDVKAKLAEIDAKSIRSMREWLTKQDDCPQWLLDYEAEAVIERKKLTKE